MQSLFLFQVQAGFPSPAENDIEKNLSLDDYLIVQPAATFFVRVKGASMQGVGIYENDILMVNRALAPRNKDIVVAVIDNEFLVKTLSVQEKQLQLLPANRNFSNIVLNETRGDYIWGVVSGIVRRYRTL